MNERSWEIYTQILSKENLKLTYSNKATTAYFNLKTREVVVPTFDYMTEEVTQLLISHEVGHAYFSDYSKEEFNKYTSLYGGLFNVVEDAHIENRMKKSFGGLSSIFKEGYKILYKEDFFELSEDLSNYNLTSRLNLFYKLGHILDVPFDGVENEFAVALKSVSSKEDVISLCERIKEYIEEQSEEEKNEEKQYSEQESSEEYGKEESSQSEGEEGTSTDEQSSELNDEISSIFEKNLSKYGEDFLSQKPQKSNSERLERFFSKEAFQNCYNVTNDYVYLKQKTFYTSKACATLTKHICELAKSADTVFQQKKKAEKLKSSKNVRVGKLNRRKLAKYLISDNLFQKTKILKEGKNHGVVILVDYSSSMSSVIKDTLIQACVLGEFCRMNDIPFSIVAFGITCHNDTTKLTALLGHNDAFDIGCVMSLMKNTSDYRMGFTPTIEALGVATYIIDAYHRAGVEKTSLFLITDGFYTPLRVQAGIQRNFDNTQSSVVIDNVLYSIDKEIPKNKRIHNNWIVEMFFLNLKKRYNTFISCSYIADFNKVKYCLRTETLKSFGYEEELRRHKKFDIYTNQIRNVELLECENYLYLWKHSYYFDEKKVDAKMKNGVITYEFKKNPFLDLFQLFDYSSIEESNDNFLSKTGNYHKRLKILVNCFIERFA